MEEQLKGIKILTAQIEAADKEGKNQLLSYLDTWSLFWSQHSPLPTISLIIYRVVSYQS